MSFASQSIYGDHELIQAMPLDTAKSFSVTGAGNVIETITLAAATKLIELRLVVYTGMAKFSVGIADAPFAPPQIPIVPGVYTYAVPTNSRLLVFRAQEASDDLDFQFVVLEA
ncbi:hypothetical protein GHL01_00405 [Sinorhizobium meliloti]|uniref:hypothetical protein n=1 Tax=Rhizobium meliloti TaxID=382 RepID=UPI00129614EB|nr:hypothetical protein [Sinorhizobium meliloti]MQV12206.1 hypothetical protein [Sinorhizobium meliloti]